MKSPCAWSGNETTVLIRINGATKPLAKECLAKVKISLKMPERRKTFKSETETDTKNKTSQLEKQTKDEMRERKRKTGGEVTTATTSNSGQPTGRHANDILTMAICTLDRHGQGKE